MNLQSTKRLHNGVEIPMEALGVFQVDDAKAAECVRWALELGYRHIDTAMIYGNEHGVGAGIKDSGVPRDKIFLTTKLWNEDMRKLRVREAFEESLARLQTDYVDLYLIHWPVPDVFTKCWAEMEKLYDEGRMRAIGVSNFHTYHLEALFKVAKHIPVVNQIELHPLLTQKTLTAYCRAHGIEMEAYRPLGGSGQYNLLSDPAICAIADKYNRSAAQILIRWNLQNDIIVLPKSTHRERIAQNAEVYDFELAAEDMQALDAMNRDFHTGSNPDTFNF